MLLALVLACTGPGGVKLTDVDTAEADADTDADTDTDTDTHTGSGVVDRDEDGSDRSTDCDDLDAEVYPGAEERWNDVDDDCDGVVDADGTWSGTVQMAASAVYEGDRYNFRLDCPYVGERVAGVLSFAITCRPDPEDASAQLLLGATLEVTPDDPEVEGDRWEGDVVFTSANGWDSDGEGIVDWSAFDAADVEVTMSGVSLGATGRGDIGRD